MKPDREYAKDEAIRQFLRRRRSAPEKIDNEQLTAGSPVSYYCVGCEILTEVLPEDYLFAPLRYCSQCQGLKAEGWLDAAQDAFRQGGGAPTSSSSE